jgi:hypothetical protein
VNNSLFVRGRQPARDLLRVVDSLARGRERTIAQAVAQRFAFEQLGNDIRRAVGLANVVNRKNVGMVQRGRRARFLREPLQALGIGRERRGQNLDRDGTVQPRVAGTIDFAHAARAQRRFDFVGAKFRARGEGHSCVQL